MDSNMFTQKVSSELRSRFDLKYEMIPLSDEEKKAYVSYKTNYYLEKVNETFHILPAEEQLLCIMDVPVHNFSNLRDINRILENHISKFIDSNR